MSSAAGPPTFAAIGRSTLGAIDRSNFEAVGSSNAEPTDRSNVDAIEQVETSFDVVAAHDPRQQHVRGARVRARSRS